MKPVTPISISIFIALTLVVCHATTQSCLAQEQSLVPGFVNFHQKVSDTEGGFTGALDDEDDFGSYLTGLGDLDNDGVRDVAVGAYYDDDGGESRGAVWVLFLNQNGTVKAYQKISDTSGGFSGTLDNYDFFGVSVANLGDLDGDGVNDLAVGAGGDDDGGESHGAVWVLFLNQNGTVKGYQKISDTSGGFSGTLDDYDNFGNSVAGLGDLDGDGVGDLAVGAWADDGGGSYRAAVWVLLLNQNGTVKGYQRISTASGGFSGTLDDYDYFGISVSGLGDLDGDGLEDLAVGAYGDGDGGSSRGAAWVLFLNQNGTVKGYQKISSTSGGFTGTLDDADLFGSSVAGLGDLNGDGVKDLAVGAWGDDDGGNNRGAVWVLFLNSNGQVKFHQKVSALAGGLNPLLLDDDDRFGSSLAGLGDLDGDGVEDLAVGATGDDDGGGNRGAAYVLFLDGTSVLPIELVSFEAVVDRGDIVLTWQTASEEDNAGFEVEEAVDLTPPATGSEPAWERLAYVQGSGTTDLPQSYKHRIEDPDPGLHRFRLKQIDFDGAFEYSSEIEVAVEVPGDMLVGSPYPNPVNARASFTLASSAEQDVRVQLVDPLGRIVRTLYEGRIPAQAGQTVVIDASDLPSGMYAVRVEGDRFAKTMNVVVQK